MSHPGVQGGPVIRQLRFGAGSRVRVHHVHGGYRLPEGLPEDAMVVVVRRDGGQVEVEHEGRRFEVALACVDSGFRVIRH